ncbi:MAG: TetR/AcrR family transcriptional regulator [Pseudolysinimonas sp.]
MQQTHLETPRVEGTAVIRNEPVQARSAARLTALLDAAAQVTAEIGYERLTTAMVADRAHASIGTVYRYFPDRIAVLQSLAARNTERTTGLVLAEISHSRHTEWTTALRAGFGHFVTAFRTEPGFASLRYGDVLDLRPAVGALARQTFSDQLFDVLVKRFALNASAEARSAFESAVITLDALAARAFDRDPLGDPAFLDAGRRAAEALLAPHWGAPTR